MLTFHEMQGLGWINGADFGTLNSPDDFAQRFKHCGDGRQEAETTQHTTMAYGLCSQHSGLMYRR